MKTGNNLTKAKMLNDELIKSILFKFGPISRGEIASLLSLTLPTITTKIKSMLKEKLVVEVPVQFKGQQNPGRPSLAIEYNPKARYFFGVEKAPYCTPIVLCDLKGTLVDSCVLDPCEDDYGRFLNSVADGIKKLIKMHNLSQKKIVGIGVGLPGLVDTKAGILKTGAFSHWHDKPIAEDLNKLLGFPVVIENNVKARAIAKELMIPSIGSESFAYFFVARGVSCPFVRRSQINGLISVTSGEAGHMIIEPEGPVCPVCGNKGCIDAVACDRILLDACRAAIEERKAPLLAQICPESEQLTIDDILKAEEQGDTFVLTQIHHLLSLLSIGLANITNLISPQTIFIDAQILTPVQNQVEFEEMTRKMIFDTNIDAVKFQFLPYDLHRGAHCAALLALKELFINVN
ncbi:MAG: ROK family transcriptional regulator [Spirochaetia bacterium]|jgi:predicted NBD/HSP70 family sugar kinase|nr:ROK family transcriptional regulator [Spirochaetia bacterium]